MPHTHQPSIALTILTPLSKKTISAIWIELETPFGNRVLLPQHAPLTLLVKPYSDIILGLPTGGTETMAISQGVFHIENNKAQLILES